MSRTREIKSCSSVVEALDVYHDAIKELFMVLQELDDELVCTTEENTSTWRQKNGVFRVMAEMVYLGHKVERLEARLGQKERAACDSFERDLSVPRKSEMKDNIVGRSLIKEMEKYYDDFVFLNKWLCDSLDEHRDTIKTPLWVEIEQLKEFTKGAEVREMIAIIQMNNELAETEPIKIPGIND